MNDRYTDGRSNGRFAMSILVDLSTLRYAVVYLWFEQVQVARAGRGISSPLLEVKAVPPRTVRLITRHLHLHHHHGLLLFIIIWISLTPFTFYATP